MPAQDGDRRDSDYSALRSEQPADRWVERALDEQQRDDQKAS